MTPTRFTPTRPTPPRRPADRSALIHLALSTAVMAVVLAAMPSRAATTAGNLGVSATVVSACVMTGTTLNFGSAIDPTAAAVPLDTTAAMTVVCTATTPYSVAMNAGTNAGSATNFTARAVKSGLHAIGYQLYSDPGHAIVWGDGTTGSATSLGIGSGSNQTLTIYGRMPSLAGAVPGVYTDTVTVTVTY